MKPRKIYFWYAGLALLISACSIFAGSPQETEQANDPSTGAIFGWVWHDECATQMDGAPPLLETPPGCVKEVSALGDYHANGELEPQEKPIPGVTVRLGEGACPSAGLSQVESLNTDLSYSFIGLKAGTYCVSIDPFEEVNQDVLLPGIWTMPAVQEGTIGITVSLAAGESKYDNNFGWDFQFKP